MSNSSGSVERFLLGLNEAKTWETLAPGDNEFVVDVNNQINQGIDGSMASGGNANAVVALQSAELVAAVAATKTFGVTNSIILTAKQAGAAGNAIAMQIINGGISNLSIVVSVSGNLILVTPITDGSGVITSTPAQIKVAMDAVPALTALVDVTTAGTAAMVAVALGALTGGADAGPGTFATVKIAGTATNASLTVVPGGRAVMTGNVGRYSRLINTGSGLASVVAKPLHRIQPYQYL